MTQALVLSNAALWVLVVVMAAVILALVRQVGVLNERIGPAGALVAEDQPRIGEPAPIFHLPAWGGQIVPIGEPDPKGRTTMLGFVAPGCPVCKTVLPILQSIQKDKPGGVRLVLASDGPREEHLDFVREHRLEASPYLLSTELGLAYHVPRLPYVVLIDAQGRVRAKGLVNTREHLESLFEALERGVGSVQEYLRREGSLSRGGNGA